MTRTIVKIQFGSHVYGADLPTSDARGSGRSP
jgi:hypothetical protein